MERKNELKNIKNTMREEREAHGRCKRKRYWRPNDLLNKYLKI
jgi:hypothetical protein